MTMLMKRWEWKLVLGLLGMFPGIALAIEPESLPSADHPAVVEPLAPSQGDDSGVRSRAPSSGSVQSPAMRQLQKVPVLPPDAVIRAGPAPTNVTLTPVTSTNIRIEWSPSPGAVRYLISRNGAPDIPIEANAGFLQGNRFIYTDIGRKPATLHTYSVMAQFNAPLLPSRSAAVQIVTPHALPPQNFKATVSGPNANAVTLTWTGRPEASGYRIVRAGGNQPATVLNVPGGLIYVDQNLPPGEYSYMICSVVRLANGSELNGEFSNPVTVQARPFNIIAIGDSVMWGQGLNDQNKFTTKAANWLKGEIGKGVASRNIARSGAITGANVTGEGPCPSDNKTCPDYSEVPWSFPTISYQARTLAPALVPSPNDVDLVLVDGCANDVNMVNIINPAGNDEELRSNTRAFCNERMQSVLTDVARTFPDAKVVVTGYFPVISGQSNLGVVVPLWVALGLVATTVTGGATLPLIPPDPIVGGVVAAILQARSAARSDLFYVESTNGLQSAVNLVNLSSRGRNRFRFAPLPVRPDNSYGALHSWLWLIPAPPGVKDEVYDARWQSCGRWSDATFDDLKCKQASLAHPNIAGAQAYTDAIKSVLTQFVPEWRTLHAVTVTAPDDSLVVRVQPGPQEPSGGTMIVTATEGPTGSPLQGAVMVNGLFAGSLGTQIRYEFRENNPTEISVDLRVSGHPQGRSFTIPVRTLSVAVNVTNSSDPRTAIVTATDAASGELRAGAVTINPNSPNQVVGTTGQPLTYPSCGQIPQTYHLTTMTLSTGLAPCSGTVHVPYYPDAYYQDVPGAVTYRLSIDKPAQIKMKPGTFSK
jgi:lysophospholipase L1-like esterase